MAHLIELPTFSDKRGNLSVLEDFHIPFSIKRIFYIYGVDDSRRGGHRHHRTRQALICITGSCRVENNNGKQKESFLLDMPKKCLIVEPEDWHVMHSFTPGTILLVLASENFDEKDYIFEEYLD
jgi:mannose-6-phosphate isomerase-like protein (cupin superfamily)